MEIDNHSNQYDSLRSSTRTKPSGMALVKQTNTDTSKGGSTKRILHLLKFLLANECTRQEIFERLAPYYKIDNMAVDKDSSSRRAGRMFERDIKLLQEQGFQIQKIKAKGRPTHYSLIKG